MAGHIRKKYRKVNQMDMWLSTWQHGNMAIWQNCVFEQIGQVLNKLEKAETLLNTDDNQKNTLKCRC